MQAPHQQSWSKGGGGGAWNWQAVTPRIPPQASGSNHTGRGRSTSVRKRKQKPKRQENKRRENRGERETDRGGVRTGSEGVGLRGVQGTGPQTQVGGVGAPADFPAGTWPSPRMHSSEAGVGPAAGTPGNPLPLALTPGSGAQRRRRQPQHSPAWFPDTAATRAPARPPAAAAHTRSGGPAAAATQPAAPAGASEPVTQQHRRCRSHSGHMGRLGGTQGLPLLGARHQAEIGLGLQAEPPGAI